MIAARIRTLMTPNVTAAMLVMAGMVMISSNDSIMKLSNSELGVGQLLFVRGVMATMIFCLYIKLRSMPLVPRVALSKWNIIRALCECAATSCFITSLTLMPIAIASTLAWTAPILVTIAAALILREKVSAKRWGAVFVGFTGALLITNPFGAEFSLTMLLPLLAATFVCARDLSTRYIDPGLPAIYILLASLVLVTIAGFIVSIGDWQPVSLGRAGWLGLCAALLGLGFLCQINAIRLADLSFIAPFSYTGILVATFYGFMIWDELPDLRSAIGIVLIVASGIYILVASKKNQLQPTQSD